MKDIVYTRIAVDKTLCLLIPLVIISIYLFLGTVSPQSRSLIFPECPRRQNTRTRVRGSCFTALKAVLHGVLGGVHPR